MPETCKTSIFLSSGKSEPYKDCIFEEIENPAIPSCKGGGVGGGWMNSTFKVECHIGKHCFIIRTLYTLTNIKVFGLKN